jgi:hypothetical protein
VSLCVHFSFKTINNKPTTTQQPNNKKTVGILGFDFYTTGAKRGKKYGFDDIFSLLFRVWEKTRMSICILCAVASIHPSIGKADEIRKKVKNIFFFFLCLAFLLGWMLLAHVSSPAANFYLLLLLIFPPHLSFFLKTT